MTGPKTAWDKCAMHADGCATASKPGQKLTASVCKDTSTGFTKQYPSINGLVVGFALEITQSQNTRKGYDRHLVVVERGSVAPGISA